jgi:hypothetical protein
MWERRRCCVVQAKLWIVERALPQYALTLLVDGEFFRLFDEPSEEGLGGRVREGADAGGE